MGGAPVWGQMASALKPLLDQGTPEEIAEWLGHYLDSRIPPYLPNLFTFAATVNMWKRATPKKPDTFPWPDGDPRWRDPKYADEALAYYTRNAKW
jgi:hypothetical protein